ncbi:MAG: PqqD family peptide modification chaperone [Euryarchaeota archaeon]|nr:PqqD family peptide modification chaperone [Euryarchaeota archaeon]
MLTKLIFPPQWIPTQPYLSIPSLTAFLRAHDCDVEQMDVNVSFYDDLLSKEGMQGSYEKAYAKLQELESGTELQTGLKERYAMLGGSVLAGKYIVDRVDWAKSILKDKDKFYDFNELNDAFRILELGLKLVSVAYYPTNLTFHAYDMQYSCRGSKSVLAAINDRKENLFIDYFEKRTVPEILEKNPGLVGISIINTSQLIPGLTMANLIKKADKNIHINIGGSVFTRLINEISHNDGLFSIVDSIIVHEGETALLGLIKHLENGFDIENVPNLIYKKGDRIRMNKLSPAGEDINLLPTPDFDGFPLEMYLSPHLVLPLLSSRGCYWGRCTFCDHSFGYSGKYRPRDASMLYNDIAVLKKKYGTGFFTFQDEGLSPKLISALSDKIIENDLNISWLADSRFEPAFSEEMSKKLARAGCKMLYFGLESGNERILACMDKGIKKENVRKICKYCSDAGIWTHLFLIFGFPTETSEEAKETMNFVLANSSIVRSMSFGSFQLTKHSKVYENPEKFGVVKIKHNDDLDISLWYECDIGRGMSKRDTDAVIKTFDALLSKRYKDFQIWRSLDREHLFLYISHYKKAAGSVSDLVEVMNRAYLKKSMKSQGTTDQINRGYPVLNDGVFVGTFNFNWGRIMHDVMMKEHQGSSAKPEKTHGLFDINNRFLTISDIAKDILDMCDGKTGIPDIIEAIKIKYQLSQGDAEARCQSLLESFYQKNIFGLG